MKEKALCVTLDGGDQVSAILSLPDDASFDTGIAIAHGAANDMHHPLLEAFAQGMAGKNAACLRFNFPYREKQKKSIDPEHRLIHTWTRALDCLKKETGCRYTIAAGKSLGARTAAQAAATGQIRPRGLIFLGYPLHAPGKKDRLRDAPLYDINIPMLFFEGTRDPFCDMDQFEKVFSKITAPKSLTTIEKADHGFGLPKADPTPAAAVHKKIIGTAAQWLAGQQFS